MGLGATEFEDRPRSSLRISCQPTSISHARPPPFTLLKRSVLYVNDLFQLLSASNAKWSYFTNLKIASHFGIRFPPLQQH